MVDFLACEREEIIKIRRQIIIILLCIHSFIELQNNYLKHTKSEERMKCFELKPQMKCKTKRIETEMNTCDESNDFHFRILFAAKVVMLTPSTFIV